MIEELKRGQFYKCKRGIVIRIVDFYMADKKPERYQYREDAVLIEEVATGRKHGLLISNFNEEGRFEIFKDEYPKYPENDSPMGLVWDEDDFSKAIDEANNIKGVFA